MNVLSTISASSFENAPLGSIFWWRRPDQMYLFAKATWNNGVRDEQGAVFLCDPDVQGPSIKIARVFQASPGIALIKNAEFRVNPDHSQLHLSGISIAHGKVIVCDDTPFLSVAFGNGDAWFYNPRTGELIRQLPAVATCGVDSWSIGFSLDEKWNALLTYPDARA